MKAGARVVAWGYRVGEVHLPPIVDMDPDVLIKLKSTRPRPRMITQTALGVQDIYACMPAPDRAHPLSSLAGLIVRLANKRPTPDSEFRRFFKREFGAWVRYWFRPVPADTDVTPEAWLAHRPYSQSRKDELAKSFREYVPDRAFRLCTAEAFIKAENYLLYKYPRWICPLPDYVKYIMGGVAHAIEEQIINLNRFIKKIPATDRVAFLSGKLFAGVAQLISEGDFSKMESQHDLFINTVKSEGFDYFVERLQDGPLYMRFFRGLGLHVDVTGEFPWHEEPTLNSKFFELFWAYILQSGKMETSIENALLNMSLYDLGNKFFFGIDYRRETNDVFEGDDAWTTSDLAAHLTTQHYLQMGHKRETRTNPNYDTESHNASGDFCSMVFEPSEGIMVTNVVVAYVGFGWASDAYCVVRPSRILELLRARAYSMIYQYDSCPILHELAAWVLRKTAHVHLGAFFTRRNKICQYEMDQYRVAYEALKRRTTFPNRCGMLTRLLVEKMYGPTVSEQVAAEEWLKRDPPLQPLNLIDPRHFEADWMHYYQSYVFSATVDDIRNAKVVPPVFPACHTVFTPGFYDAHGHQIRGFGATGQDAVTAMTP